MQPVFYALIADLAFISFGIWLLKKHEPKANVPRIVVYSLIVITCVVAVFATIAVLPITQLASTYLLLLFSYLAPLVLIIIWWRRGKQGLFK